MNRLGGLDFISLAATLTLSVMGVVFIRSATSGQEGSILWMKQAAFIVLGMIIYLVLSYINYEELVRHSQFLFAAGMAALVLVLVFGEPINGARSWFRLPFMSLQPSEIMKIATILVITRYFDRFSVMTMQARDTTFKKMQTSLLEFIVFAFLVGLPVILIVLQPDLGTALVYLPMFIIPNFLLGRREGIWVTVGGLALVGILILGVVHKPQWVFFLKDYQKARIVAFIYPEEDTSNRGYQVHQSKISIGQGGLFGMGYGKGQHSRMGFLPAQHNDFIVAVAAEEFGFIGILFIFSLFLTIFIRGFFIGSASKDATASCLVVLVIGTLFVQALFNAAMLIGLVPTTGIPFPLLSYGGSSFLTTMGLLGLIQSVHLHRFVNS
jgi:rod shape determining protein RodA